MFFIYFQKKAMVMYIFFFKKCFSCFLREKMLRLNKKYIRFDFCLECLSIYIYKLFVWFFLLNLIMCAWKHNSNIFPKKRSGIMISQYRTSSSPAFECHHPYKDLSGRIPTVSERLVRLQRRQRGKTTFRSRRKCLRHQIPQRICTPGKLQWNSLKVKRKYIFIRRLLHD